MASSSGFLLLFLLLAEDVQSYEAPEDKQNVFARSTCPAFLSFTNVAHPAGATVELPCHCKPQQVQSVLWFFKKHLGSEEASALNRRHGNMLLDTSQVPHSRDLRSRFTVRLFSLLIFRTGPDDSGLYICGSAQKDFFYGYDLDVQEVHRISVSPSLVAQRPAQEGVERRHPFQVFTSFRPWAVCDRCGIRGEQVRVGLCYVRSQFLHVRYRRANETVASCGSGAVPRAFGDLLQSRAKAQLEVRGCQVTCPRQPSLSSRLLALTALLGVSSASVPAEVPVFYLNHAAGQVLTLGCPGAGADAAVAWDRGSRPIYRSQRRAGDETSRLQINGGHHLVFTPAEAHDTGAYSCWLQGRRAAEIRLLVYVHLGQGRPVTSHPDFMTAVNAVMMSCVAMTTVFFLLVAVRAGIRFFRDKDRCVGVNAGQRSAQ